MKRNIHWSLWVIFKDEFIESKTVAIQILSKMKLIKHSVSN